MDEYDDELSSKAGEPADEHAAAEGVRIIGADEAARALEQGQAAGRRPTDAPRYGDVPRRPEGPRPAQRFPLPESVDPAEVRRPPLAGWQAPPSAKPIPRQPVRPAPREPAAVPPPEEFLPVSEEIPPRHETFPPEEMPTPLEPTGVEMPHWTEPATGEVPRILASEEPDEDQDAWTSYAGRAPRWRDSESDWAESDFEGLSLEDAEERIGVFDTNRTAHSDLFSFDEPEVTEEPDLEPEPQPEPVRSEAAAATSIRTRQRAEPARRSAPSGGDRDTRMAAIVGIAIMAVALVLFWAGPAFALVLATVIVTLAGVEVFDVLRRAGYRPATLLGLVGIVGIMVATYVRGEMALPIVLGLVTVSTFCWYLFGVVQARATVNAAVTLFGFLWVGMLGSFAALLLKMPNRQGVAFLLGAVIATVVNDLGGWFFGSQFGSRPLMPDISPNKTVEGVAGGVVSSVLITMFVLGVFPGVEPWTVPKAFVLALVVAVVGTLGDLCESMVKRDLGIKDMGTLLPGHGGVMDRFDAMLFALPATYFVVSLLFG